ncbi:unnamed protein product [Moneuplotes crassus]|uniref:Uncharacterized protein n=1 Tax=Euplotes crassus TaxID=5936 RepID=A0AAD1X821_EUPCR|nr:unnamed protein product [Moneuplotes crassus]
MSDQEKKDVNKHQDELDEAQDLEDSQDASERSSEAREELSGKTVDEDAKENLEKDEGKYQNDTPLEDNNVNTLEQDEDKSLKVEKREEEGEEENESTNSLTKESKKNDLEHEEEPEIQEKENQNTMNDPAPQSKILPEDPNEDTLISTLKVQLAQEQKKSTKLQREKEMLKSNYEEEIAKLQETLNSTVSELNKSQSKNRKLEIKLYNIEVERTKQGESFPTEEKLSDNKKAHYETMKRDMTKLIGFKNELESVVEQQNTELEQKSEDLRLLSNELSEKEQEIAQMTEYISNLEKHNKESQQKISKNDSKFKRSKKGKSNGATEIMRQQEEEIEMLKSMVTGGKKELQTKMHNIKILKRKLHNLEKINKLHLSKHSDVQSIISGGYGRNKDPFSRYEEVPSGNENAGCYNSPDKGIEEVRKDLEETGKFINEKTAHFGNTMEPKKDFKISKQSILKNSSFIQQTPKSNLLKSSKFKSKRGDQNRNSVQRAPVPGLEGTPTIAMSDPFDSRVKQGYDQYCINLSSPGYKNNSYGMSHVLASSSSAIELPSIKKRGF